MKEKDNQHERDLHASPTIPDRCYRTPAFSKADLTMAAMPGMAAMKMPSTAALAADGRTLVVTPKGRLAAGRYTVDWHIVSTDTHKVAGNYAFTVK